MILGVLKCNHVVTISLPIYTRHCQIDIASSVIQGPVFLLALVSYLINYLLARPNTYTYIYCSYAYFLTYLHTYCLLWLLMLRAATTFLHTVISLANLSMVSQWCPASVLSTLLPCVRLFLDVLSSFSLLGPSDQVDCVP